LCFDDQHNLGFFDDLPLPPIGARDRKPVCANRKFPLKNLVADPARFLSTVQRDIENSHGVFPRDRNSIPLPSRSMSGS
jgi:hypothetical protein